MLVPQELRGESSGSGAQILEGAIALRGTLGWFWEIEIKWKLEPTATRSN